MFDLDKEQLAKLNEWMKTRPKKYEGCSGGRYIYQFCPTSLGLVVKVIDDITKEEIDLTDYENW
jgi:hypothetical protein